MRSRTIVTVTALSLAISGGALAEGTGSHSKQEGQHGTSGVQQQQTDQQQASQKQQATQQKQQAAIEAVRISSLNNQQVMELQQQLQNHGYYRGAVDGIVGPLTRNALIQYHHAQIALLNQNRVSEASLRALGFEQSEIQRVRGVDQEQGATGQGAGEGQTQPQQPDMQREQPGMQEEPLMEEPLEEEPLDEDSY